MLLLPWRPIYIALLGVDTGDDPWFRIVLLYGWVNLRVLTIVDSSFGDPIWGTTGRCQR